MKKQDFKKISALVLPVILALTEICLLVGLVRCVRSCNVNGLLLHIALAFVLGLFIPVLLFGLSPKNKIKIRLPLSLGVGLLFDILWVVLIGFRLYEVGLILPSVLLALAVFFRYGFRWNKKAFLTAVVTLVLALSLTMPYFADLIQISDREKEVPLTSYDDPTALPHALPAKTVYHYIWDEEEAELYDSDYCTFFQTLQGQLARIGDEQLFITYYTRFTAGQKKAARQTAVEDDDYDLYRYEVFEMPQNVTANQIEMMKKYYDVTVVEITSFSDLMDKVAGKIKKYILCDGSDAESKAVGVSLCNQMDAVLLPWGLHHIGEKYGWKLVFSTVGKDTDWLISSPYFEKINKNIIIMPPYDLYQTGTHCDYAVLSGAWVVPQVYSEKELESYLKYANRGFTFWGIRGTKLSENAMVTLTAKYGGTYLYSQGMRNLAVLSGFRLENVIGKDDFTKTTRVTDLDENPVSGKHSVCIMFSDGDNMQYTAENNLFNIREFGSLKRSEDYSLSYGMSGMMMEVIPIMWLAYLEKLYPNESLVMQISSVGYTYPSKWTDEEAFDEMMKRLVHAMQIGDIRLVEIMDDISVMNTIDLPVLLDSLQSNFDKYTAQEQIDGCFFITYQQRYAGFRGEVCWSNGKPVVSARYSIWSEESGGSKKNTLEYVASQINSASTDVTSEDAYSFVIVHAWSGLDKEGNYVSGGDTMAAVQKLADMLDDDVELVNADEFIARMTRYVKR